MVVSTYGAISHWIDMSWWTHAAISCLSQCSITVLTKAVVCAILSVDGAYKRLLAVNQKESPCSGSSCSFTICLMSYSRELDVLSVSFNITFRSFSKTNLGCDDVPDVFPIL